MRPRLRTALLVASALAALVVIGGALYLQRFQTAEFWESSIEDYEAADRQDPPAPGAVVFTGSSSIRMWQTLDRDMAPYRVLNRGFGGAHLDHVVTFAPRIVAPYEPSAIVLYAGDNDVAAGKDAARVATDFDRFVAFLREAGLSAPVFFVSIKPSRLRFDDWPTMAQANEAIAAICAADASLHYVDIAGPMLASAGPGEPPPEQLFMLDGLHLSAEGYALWTGVVRAALERELGEHSAETPPDLAPVTIVSE